MIRLLHLSIWLVALGFAVASAAAFAAALDHQPSGWGFSDPEVYWEVKAYPGFAAGAIQYQPGVRANWHT